MLPDGSALVESPTDPDHTFISGTTQGLILHRNNRWPNVALFGAAHFANAFSMGIQVVLMAWLAVGVLRLPAGEVGWVQASVFLPNVLLILYAGGFSDRKSAAAISMYANLAVALSHGIACTLYLLGYLNFQTLLLYALLLGAGNAFVQTAREKLVVQTGGGQIHRVISIAGVCQFGAQALGMAVVSFSDRWGVEWLLALQGGTCLVAAVLYGALARLSRATEPGQASTASLSLSAVLADAWASLPMRHTLILVGFNGAMHLGFFIVVLPLMARDIMGFTSFEYSFLQLTFVTGSVAAHAWMLYKAVQYPGQNILFCLLYSGVIGFALSAGPTVAGLYARPTVVNNVESIASVPGIVAGGQDWFTSMGTEKSAGHGFFSVSGHVVRPGQYEAPLGITMRELIEMAGGIRPGHRVVAGPDARIAPCYSGDHRNRKVDRGDSSDPHRLRRQ